MKIQNQFLRMTAKFISKHATKILAAGAITSEGFMMWLMHKRAPVARKKLDELGPDAKTIDKIKTVGPVYLPAFMMMLTSVGCIVGGTALGDHRQAVMASLYSASEAALMNYQKKVVDKIGTEKAQEIQNAVAQELIDKDPVDPANITATGKGDQLFYEPLSARYFTSSWDEVQKAMIRLNRRIIGDMWVTVNEWYEELGLEEAGLGETVGWNVDHMLELSRSPTATLDDRTCWMIGYPNKPVLYK